MKKATMKVLLMLVALALTTCGDEKDSSLPEAKSLCERVVDKIAMCLGARVPLTSCSAESADYILNSECDSVIKYIRGEQP
tara:strand:- start:62 stop:304 length:243 start_codon:yes stop_codon:yes gene_type:complete